MAHDIDEVWQLCKDIQTDLNQLQPIKAKCDEIIATLALKETVKQICGRCHGTKKCIISYPTNPVTNVEEDCPQCGGTGLVTFGEANE